VNRVDATVDPAPPIADVEAKLRAEAATLGADAVVVVLDRVQPVGAYVTGPYLGRTVDTITGRKLVGIAIKYRLVRSGVFGAVRSGRCLPEPTLADAYSTVTLFARFLGLSTSVPRVTAV